MRWPKGREKPKSSKHSAQRAHTEAANEKAGNEKRARRTVSRTTQSPPTTSGSPVQDLEELSQSRVHAELEHKSTWSRLKVNLSHFLFSKAMEGAQGPFGQQQQVNHPTLPTTHPFQARRPLCRRICQTLSGMPDRCHANAVSSKTGKKAAPSRIVVLTSGVRE